MPDAIATTSQDLLARLPKLDADQLEQLVRHHNAAYWDHNEPEIDDPTFDKLLEALRQQRPTSSVLDELGESNPADGAERRFESVVHEAPMLSLEKCYDDDVLKKWQGKIQGGYTVTPKLDGLACSLRYDDSGKLEVCATRGDGRTGDNITANASRIDDIPTQLPATVVAGRRLEVRGEVFMRLSRFRDHYAQQFANPRNLAAGALKHKEPDKSAAYGLSFFAYDVLGAGVATEVEKLDLARACGFPLPDIEFVEEAGDLADSFRRYTDKRDVLDYEIDGVVMKADRVSEADRLGSTAHHPRWAIAYKFQGDGAQTKLVQVEWSMGRTGVITPVAIVNPVFVSGATVTRASLHNAGYMHKLGVKQGALVELVRRGGVIPHVERVISAAGDDVELPSTCPSCGGSVRQEGDFLFCDNPDSCPAVVRGRVSHFTRVIDVIGFGDKHLTQLLDKQLVQEPADLYALTVDQLTSLERMGEKLANKLLAEIDAKRTLPLATFLTALGIEQVGPTVAEAICEHFGSFDKIRGATASDLAAIPGVGPSIAQSLVQSLVDLNDEVEALLKQVTLVDATAAPVTGGGALAGKSFVFTGKLAHLDRKGAQQKVKGAGGKTPAGVSADVDYLVIGDEGSPLFGAGNKSSKHKAADKLVANGASIAIISETDFLKMVP